MLTFALVVATLQTPEYRFDTLEDVIRGSYPAAEWRLEGERPLLEIPLVVRGEGEVLPAAQWATGTRLEVDEDAKKLTLRRDDAYWKEVSGRSAAARLEALRKQLEQPVEPPTSEEFDVITGRMYQLIARGTEMIPFYEEEDKLRKAFFSYQNPTLNLVPPEWAAQVPPTGEIRTMTLSRQALRSPQMQEALARLGESRNAMGRLLADVKERGEAGGLAKIQSDTLHAYFSRFTEPPSMEAETGFISSRHNIGRREIWIRAYDAAGRMCFYSKFHLTEEAAQLDPPHPPIETSGAVEIDPQLGLAVLQLNRKTQLQQIHRGLWEAYSQPFSPAYSGPIYDGLRGDAEAFVAWLPDRFYLDAMAAISDGDQLNLAAFQGAANASADGWHMEQSNGWRGLRPNFPEDQLKRTLGAEDLHQVTQTMLPPDGYKAIRWLDLFRQHGRRVLANRHVMSAWRGLVAFTSIEWPWLDVDIAMIAENAQAYAWFRQYDQTGLAPPTQIQIPTTEFILYPQEGEGTDLSRDPATWPRGTYAATLSSSEFAPFLVSFHELCWSDGFTPDADGFSGLRNTQPPGTQWGLIKSRGWEVRRGETVLAGGELDQWPSFGPASADDMQAHLRSIQPKPGDPP